jgi:hypothetical protein
MRFRADDLRRQGWAPPQTLQIPDWCGCSTEYLPVPTGDGWWSLVPIWEPEQTPTPLRRWERPVPYWARTRDPWHGAAVRAASAPVTCRTSGSPTYRVCRGPYRGPGHALDRSAHPVVATACCHCMIFFIICARSPKGSARNRLHRLQDVEDHVGTRVLRCSRFVPWTRPHSLHDQTAQPSRRGSCQVEGDSRLRKFVSSATQAASLAAQRNALKLRRRSAPTAG